MVERSHGWLAHIKVSDKHRSWVFENALSTFERSGFRRIIRKEWRIYNVNGAELGGINEHLDLSLTVRDTIGSRPATLRRYFVRW